jgi:hypothetical protein
MSCVADSSARVVVTQCRSEKCGSHTSAPSLPYYYFGTNRALAETAFEDTYMTVLDVDGTEWADNLRAKMHPRTKEPLPTEQTWLIDRMT